MVKFIVLIIFIAISIYSKTREAQKTAQEAKRRQQMTQPEPDAEDDDDEELDEGGQTVQRPVAQEVTAQAEDDYEAALERMRRERDEMIARREEERRLQEEADKARRAFEAHAKAEASAAASCVDQRMSMPSARHRRKVPASEQIEEGVRSTSDSSMADAGSDVVGALTPDDARRAVILDAVFRRKLICKRQYCL